MNLKLSQYTVFSNPVDDSGKVLVFSTRSGSILAISSLCHQFLTTNHVELIPGEMLQKLMHACVVVPESDNELDSIISENIASCNDDNGTLLMVIQPSANCQLGCYYCGQAHTKNSIQKHTYDTIISRIKNKLEKGTYHSLVISWFGGEPLMALGEMRDITRQLQTICAERGVIYKSKMVSNGLALKEQVFVELVRDMGMRSIEITLDGIEEDHDSHRYTKGGGKSFKTIYSNLKNIVNRSDFRELNCKISIRCNIDELNKDAFMPLFHKLRSDKILSSLVSCYAASIYSWGNDAHKGALARVEYAEKELNWDSELFQIGFRKWSIPARNRKLCLATIPSQEMFDAFGNTYNCTEISYVPAYDNSEYKVGQVEGDYYIPLPVVKTSDAINLANWNETLKTDKFPCHTCNMLPVCGGRCPKQWYEGNAACPSAKYIMPDRLVAHYFMLNSHKMQPSEKQKMIDFHKKKWVTNILS
jgi:uncharacterized protein